MDELNKNDNILDFVFESKATTESEVPMYAASPEQIWIEISSNTYLEKCMTNKHFKECFLKGIKYYQLSYFLKLISVICF